DVGTQRLDQCVDLALEPRRDIVDRSEQDAGHRVNMPPKMWSAALKKLHLMLGRFPGSTLTDADRRRQRLLLAIGRGRSDLCRREAARRPPAWPRDDRRRPERTRPRRAAQ